MNSQGATTTNLKVGKTIEFPMGSDTELLAITGHPTKLSVLYNDKFETGQVFRSGNFSVHMVIINTSDKPISMVNCMVGDHQWMLAKDSVVATLEEGRFIFGLPGFLYGLELPHEGPRHKYAKLEDVFSKFCDYYDLSPKEGHDYTSSSTNPWIHAYNKFEKLTAWQATPESATNNLTKMERAVRTSAVVKLLSRSLLTGAIHPSKHVQIGVDSTETRTVLPTMRVISDLLNALETGRAPVNKEVPGGSWRVNVEGVMSLLRVMRSFGARMVSISDGKRKREGDGSAMRGMRRASCGGRSPVQGFRLGTCGNS